MKVMRLDEAGKRLGRDGREFNQRLRRACVAVARTLAESRAPTLTSAVLQVFQWRMSGTVSDDVIRKWRDGIDRNRDLPLRDYQRKILEVWQPYLRREPRPDADACLRLQDRILERHGPSWSALAPLKAYALVRRFERREPLRYALIQPLGHRVRQGIRSVFKLRVGESGRGYALSRSLHESLARIAGSNTADINSGLLVAPARWKGRCPRCRESFYEDYRADTHGSWCADCFGDDRPAPALRIRWSKH